MWASGAAFGVAQVGGEERVGLKLRFSKSELAAAAAELAAARGSGSDETDVSDEDLPELPAAADDDGDGGDGGSDPDRRGRSRNPLLRLRTAQRERKHARDAPPRVLRASRRRCATQGLLGRRRRPRTAAATARQLPRAGAGARADRAFLRCCAALSPARERALTPHGALQDQPVWAKLRGFPPWPAQVLSARAGHQAPPKPRPQCVLVHFFGTYDIQWLESEKKARARRRHALRRAGALTRRLAPPRARRLLRALCAGEPLPRGLRGPRRRLQAEGAPWRKASRASSRASDSNTKTTTKRSRSRRAGLSQGCGGVPALRGHRRRGGRRAAGGHDRALRKRWANRGGARGVVCGPRPEAQEGGGPVQSGRGRSQARRRRRGRRWRAAPPQDGALLGPAAARWQRRTAQAAAPSAVRVTCHLFTVLCCVVCLRVACMTLARSFASGTAVRRRAHGA